VKKLGMRGKVLTTIRLGGLGLKIMGPGLAKPPKESEKGKKEVKRKKRRTRKRRL